MRRPELDSILTTMLGSQSEVSDLLFTVNKPFQVEALGELKPVAFDPPIERLTPFQTEMVALNLIGENLWHIEDLLWHGSCDFFYALSDKARFRVNVFSQPRIVATSGNGQNAFLRKDRLGACHGCHRLRKVYDHCGRA